MMNIVFIEKEKKLINRVEIKTEAKTHLRGNWKYPILITLVTLVLSTLFNFRTSMSYVTGIRLSATDEVFSFIWQFFAFIISVASAFFTCALFEKERLQTFKPS